MDVHITTLKNCLPTSKPAFGRFRVLPDKSAASFIEEGGRVISGEGKARRVLRGKNFSVWFDEENGQYRIRVVLKASDAAAAMMAQCDFEECINYIRRRDHEKECE